MPNERNESFETSKKRRKSQNEPTEKKPTEKLNGKVENLLIFASHYCKVMKTAFHVFEQFLTNSNVPFHSQIIYNLSSWVNPLRVGGWGRFSVGVCVLSVFDFGCLLLALLLVLQINFRKSFSVTLIDISSSTGWMKWYIKMKGEVNDVHYIELSHKIKSYKDDGNKYQMGK